MLILHNFKGYLRKLEEIVGTSSNISEFDRPTILGAKGDLGSEERCTITKLLCIGRLTLEIASILQRCTVLSSKMYDNQITAV